MAQFITVLSWILRSFLSHKIVLFLGFVESDFYTETIGYFYSIIFSYGESALALLFIFCSIDV